MKTSIRELVEAKDVVPSEEPKAPYVRPGEKLADIQLRRTRKGMLDAFVLPEDMERDKEWHYRFVRKDKVDFRKMLGYDLVPYEPFFGGTGRFTKTAEGHVQHGDVFLMRIPRRQWEELVAERESLHEKREKGIRGKFHDLGDKLGIETLEEKRPG